MNGGNGQTSRPWVIRNGDQWLEAADLDALVALVASGKVRHDSYVQDPVSGEWKYAGELVEFRAPLAAQKRSQQEWIVNQGGHSTPVEDVATLRTWVHEYRIERTTKIRNPHLQRWMSAGDILELKEAFSTRPEIVFDAPSPQRSGFPPLLAAVLAAIVVLAAVAIFSASHRKAQPVVAATSSVTSTAASAEATVAKPKPRMTILNFGKREEAAATTTAAQQTTTAAATGTSAPAPTATTTDTAAPSKTSTASAPRPAAADDAETVDQDEDADFQVRGNDAVRVTASGDTPVVIDRSGRDPYYHLSGCSRATGDLATVSLDLAKHGHSACPVCKPPM